MITARIAVAAILLAATSWIVWYGLDRALAAACRRSSCRSVSPRRPVLRLPAAVLRMGIPEARQVRGLVLSRSGAGSPAAGARCGRVRLARARARCGRARRGGALRARCATAGAPARAPPPAPGRTTACG